MREHLIELMQHALGINERQREPFRNYFLSSGEDADWQELVASGYATAQKAPSWSCGDITYHVTDKGRATAIAALSEPKNKRDSAYEMYIRLECCESFGEWLLGSRLPKYKVRSAWPEKGCLYQMYRLARDNTYDTQRIAGEWCPTKKAAKASYKEALRRSKESCHA